MRQFTTRQLLYSIVGLAIVSVGIAALISMLTSYSTADDMRDGFWIVDIEDERHQTNQGGIPKIFFFHGETAVFRFTDHFTNESSYLRLKVVNKGGDLYYRVAEPEPDDDPWRYFASWENDRFVANLGSDKWYLCKKGRNEVQEDFLPYFEEHEAYRYPTRFDSFLKWFR